MKAPPPFIIILAISGFVSAVCTTSGQANTLSYYDRRKWFGETYEDADSDTFSYEFVTFFIASIGGSLSVLLSNSLTDDGSASTKPGIQNVAFSISIFMSLLITKNPPLHCLFAALPFAFGLLVPYKANSHLSRLSILAPQALTVFLTSYYINPHTPSSTSVSSSASNLIVMLALLITFMPNYTSKKGISILVLALLACVPPTMDFGTSSHIPVRAPFTSLVATFAILSASWLVLNHRHKNGALTVDHSPPAMRSFSIACLCSLRIALALSTVRLADAHTSYARDPTLVLFQVFMGATATLFFTCFASAVAESWYPVGSMQFQMVAWDTLGLLFYFVLPIGILFYKAWYKYEIAATLVSWGMEGGDAYKIVNSLATLAVTTTAICLPILNKHSILCSNWFAKCYTHGQPNTNRISITADFSDIFPASDATEGSDDGQAKLWAACKKHEARLTIFVTAENLAQNPHLIAELSKAHNIGITTEASFLERWTPVKNRVHQAAIDYFKVIGKQPTWYRGVGGHRHPSAFLAANKLGMRVAFWSTYGEIAPSWAEDTTSTIMMNFKSDFMKTRGGNILLIRRGDGNKSSVAGNLEELLTTFGADGIIMDTLDSTVKKDHDFILD